jgi:ubiquinol-cytochrome c reductase cytochrome c1 subunit
MMKNSLLSAVVALGVVAPASFALAQETGTTTEELQTTPLAGTGTAEEAPAAEGTTTAPTTEAPASDVVVAEEPATEEAAAEEPASEAPAADVETAEPVQEEAEEAAEEVAEDQPAVVEEAETEVIAEDDVAGQASTDEPDVGVMEKEDHGEVEEHAAAGDDHGGDSHATPHIENIDFSFDGPFGSYDVNQLQRGLQIYTEVCAACHGLKYVAMRTLGDEGGPGLPEEQVIEYAKQFDIYDADLDDFRPGTPVDHFPDSNLATAPDLSLMAKKRAAFHGPYGLGINQFLKGIGGPEYITALLTSYTGEEKEQAGTVLYGNSVFPGGWIAMAPPLADEQVEFVDGHANDLQHLAEDVSAFLMWTAEPKLAARKQAGFAGVIFLTLLSVLLYLTNKRLWARHKYKDQA